MLSRLERRRGGNGEKGKIGKRRNEEREKEKKETRERKRPSTTRSHFTKSLILHYWLYQQLNSSVVGVL